MPDVPDISPAFQSIGKRKLLPTNWTHEQLKSLDAATRRQAFFSAQNHYKKVLNELRTDVQKLVGGDTMMDFGTARLKVRGMLNRLGYEPEEGEGGTIKDLSSDARINLVLRTNRDIAQGMAQHVTDNDERVVAAFPAWELIRVADRNHPRGERDPEDGWDARWEAACVQANDLDALSVFDQTGRRVALKSSGVWEALGDGAGGYEDTLSSPFPPFAFNSGMGVENVSANECVELGLMEEDQEVEPSDLDLAELFNEGTSEGAYKGWETRRHGFMKVPDTEILSKARADTDALDHHIKYRLESSARGSVVGASEPQDDWFQRGAKLGILEDPNNRYGVQLYNSYTATREALRRKYGDTITLWRAQGTGREAQVESWDPVSKNTLKYASRETAKLYMGRGRELTARKVRVDDIVAVFNPSSERHKDGGKHYEEFIVINHNSPGLEWPPSGYTLSGGKLVR